MAANPASVVATRTTTTTVEEVEDVVTVVVAEEEEEVEEAVVVEEVEADITMTTVAVEVGDTGMIANSINRTRLWKPISQSRSILGHLHLYHSLEHCHSNSGNLGESACDHLLCKLSDPMGKREEE